MQGRKLLHGGDYNPEQWLDRPDILAQDIELMKKARVNTVLISFSNGLSVIRSQRMAGGHHPQPLRQRNPHDSGYTQRGAPRLAGMQIPGGAPCAG